MTTTSTMIFLKLGAIFGKTRHWLGVRVKVREFINELSISDDAVDWKKESNDHGSNQSMEASLSSRYLSCVPAFI